MNYKGNTQVRISQVSWAILGCMLLPLSSYGVLFQVEQLSNPAGFVSDTEAIEGGTTKHSVTPNLSTNGYAFGYWKINGIRQTGDDNRSLTQVSTSISANTTFTAYYFSESEDTDSDGIKDWYEYRMFGSLNMGPTDDPDSDGFNNKRESELGQDPLIVDAVEWGGISGRLSTGFTYADTSMVLAVVKSDPAGFVTETSNYLDTNSTVTTSSLHGATNGYNFAYWSVNGVRQAGPTGVSMSKVEQNIIQTTSIIAHYKPSTEDTDGDGVMDWFELYQFGNLTQGPSDDPDGDGFSNKREGELGQEATIADTVEWGGISGRLSPGFTYADNSMVLAVIKSDPAGFVTETSNYLDANSTVTTSSLHGATNGYNFAYWSVNGVRQAGPTGVSLSKVATDVNATTNIVAHYKPSNEDSDSDGVMDWFELYQFGDLNQSGTDDPDGDGFSNKREGELGQEATIADNVEWGGISGRLSPGILYYQQQNRPPSNLELNNTLVFLNKDANQTVGSFTPTDPDDPGRVRTYTYQFLSGAGGEDNNKFNLLGQNLRTAQILTTEGNYSIQIRVSDDENTSLDKNFTIQAIHDPNKDDDNDSLTYAQEQALGTSDQNPDSDGDGFSDLVESNYGSNPNDANSTANAAPMDLNNSTSASFFEKQPIGTLITDFNATDPDVNATLSYSISGPNAHLFTIDQNGTLFTHAIFDFETNASVYNLSVRVTDEHNASQQISRNIILKNINESPTLLSLSNNTLLENQPAGTVVGEFNATDPDANATLNYALVDGNGSTGNLFFNLDTNGTLKSAAVFDYENNESNYSIRVQVRDEHNASLEKTFVINLLNEVEDLDGDGIEDFYDPDDDNDGFTDSVEIAYGSDPRDANSTANAAPTDLNNSTSASFFENQPIGTLIKDFNATDPDVNATLTYSISGPNAHLFSIDQNGSLFTDAIFDFETNASVYNLSVRVTDEHNASQQISRNIILKNINETPISLSLSSNPLLENQPVGTVIGEFNATDPDVNATLTYSLVDGNESINNEFFILEENGTLKSANTFDYENNESNYTIRVQVKDEHNASLEKAFLIQLENLNENPVIHSANIGSNGPTLLDLVSVPENSTLILEINASDPDGDAIDFYKTAGLDRDLFDLNASTGVLTFKNSPDFENPTDSDANNSYIVWFRAGDENGGHSEKRLTVLVTNVIEDFDQDGIEDHYDPDDDNDGFSDAEELAYGSDPRDVNSTANAPPSSLTLQDLNFSENLQLGTIIGRFNSVDPDANSSLNYALIDGNISNDNNLFSIDANGSLFTDTVFDYEGNHSGYFIRVRVADEHNASLAQTFSLTLQDRNEAPTALNSTASLTVAENLPVGTVVGQLTADDPDANSSLTYTLVGGANDNQLFSIDTNGTLKTTARFDYESNSSYAIRVKVRDQYNLWMKQDFTVNVLNLVEDLDQDGIEDAYDSDIDGDGYSNENELAYPSDPLDANSVADTLPTALTLSNLEVMENLPIGSVIGQFTVIDPDINDAHIVKFNDINQNISHNHLFSIDANNTLRTAVVFDYEHNSSTIHLRVKAKQEQVGVFWEFFTLSLIDDPSDNSPTNQSPTGGDQTPDGNNSSPIDDQNETIPPQSKEIFLPILQTLTALTDANGTHHLAGKILTDGGSPIFEAGFLVSKKIFLSDPIRITALVESNATQYHASISELSPNTTYYFRAFAVNAVGENRGALKKFRTPKQVVLNDWQKGAVNLADGWKTLDWLGTYRDTGHIWIYHSEMGWLYPSAMEDGSLWLWNESDGWRWTQQNLYPYLFRWRDSSWLYFQGKFGGRIILYNYSTQSFE